MVTFKDHKRYLQRDGFLKHKGLCQYNQDEDRILTRYGYWMTALTSGVIPPITKKQEVFLRVHTGEKKAISEYEQAWTKYRTAKGKVICNKLYDRACKFQRRVSRNPSTRYELIVNAFRIAAHMGSFKARQWLEAQAQSSVKPNSFWCRPEGGAGGQVNNLHIDEINDP